MFQVKHDERTCFLYWNLEVGLYERFHEVCSLPHIFRQVVTSKFVTIELHRHGNGAVIHDALTKNEGRLQRTRTGLWE